MEEFIGRLECVLDMCLWIRPIPTDVGANRVVPRAKSPCQFNNKISRGWNIAHASEG